MLKLVWIGQRMQKCLQKCLEKLTLLYRFWFFNHCFLYHFTSVLSLFIMTGGCIKLRTAASVRLLISKLKLAPAPWAVAVVSKDKTNIMLSPKDLPLMRRRRSLLDVVIVEEVVVVGLRRLTMAAVVLVPRLLSVMGLTVSNFVILLVGLVLFVVLFVVVRWFVCVFE